MYCLTKDRLGSTVMAKDTESEVVSGTYYNAWGEAVNTYTRAGFEKSVLSVPSYTGHRYDNISGLYYAKARMYSADDKRFTSIDPIKDGLNWYEYCKGNPNRYTDPRGLMHSPSSPGYFEERERILMGEENVVRDEKEKFYPVGELADFYVRGAYHAAPMTAEEKRMISEHMGEVAWVNEARSRADNIVNEWFKLEEDEKDKPVDPNSDEKPHDPEPNRDDGTLANAVLHQSWNILIKWNYARYVYENNFQNYFLQFGSEAEIEEYVNKITKEWTDAHEYKQVGAATRMDRINNKIAINLISAKELSKIPPDKINEFVKKVVAENIYIDQNYKLISDIYNEERRKRNNHYRKRMFEYLKEERMIE